MYIAYGWPKLLKVGDEISSDSTILSIHVGGGLLVVVAADKIQVWTAGQHRIKLGESLRNYDSIAEDGSNYLALWNANIETLCIITSKNLIHFYDVNATGKPLRVGNQDSDAALRPIRVKYRSTTAFPDLPEHVTVNTCVADDLTVVLGLSNGCLQAVSWRGQPRGSTDLWQSAREIPGPLYLAEANGVPATPLSPGVATAFSPTPTGAAGGLSAASSLRRMSARLSDPGTGERGIAQLVFCESHQLLVAVLVDGRVLLCNCGQKGLRPVDEIVASRWVGILDGVCAAVGEVQGLLAVGSRRGTVELFNLADGAMYMRTISLFDWGYMLEDTGAVSCISWTPDNRALAVGWTLRGLAVWSVSGCRLMCTIRQGSMSHVLPSSPPMHAKSSEPMSGGVAGLTWGEHAYQLVGLEVGSSSRLVQFAFAKGCVGQGLAGSPHVWQLMAAEDRLLLIHSDEVDELKLQHLVIPRTYISLNWPVLHVAANEDGSYIAIAGTRGVILYNLRAKRWRLFGDIVQERAIKAVALLWLGKMLLVCNHRESNNTYELSIYPRYHLDESSLLHRQTLPARPIAIDAWRDYILVATPHLEIRVFHVQLEGQLQPLRKPTVTVRLVRELSIMSARKPPVSMRFVPGASTALAGSDAAAVQAAAEGAVGGGIRDITAEAALRQPTKCMLLRTDGELSILDLERGSERQLVPGVEHFWLTSGRPKEEVALIHEVPWWVYGHRGMQVWYPSSQANTSGLSDDLHQLDPELDFDREVYPLGVSPAAGVIVGVSQRLCMSACAEMPCFEPTPQAQPILPCLLRHLLQRNQLDEAVKLARLSASRPHFSHSLEWLLFTVFDAEMSLASARKRARLKHQPLVDPPTGPSMLDRACTMIRHFPEYLDVVVSVARKTDSRHWPELFAAAGRSSGLFEECFEKKRYRTATCYILVIEKLEGPSVSQQNALRLLQATLQVSLYELAGELVRFLLRSGREYTYSGKEDDGQNEGLLKSFFSFGFTNSHPKVRADVLHVTVKHILGSHAVQLLTARDLRALAAFVKGTQFDLAEFLRSERGRNTRAALGDFSTALRTARQKLGESPQSRQDAELLLGHMRTAGFKEWTLVLATLLNKTEVMLDLFQKDRRLWASYSKLLEAQSNFAQYEELLDVLRAELGAPAEQSPSEKRGKGGDGE